MLDVSCTVEAEVCACACAIAARAPSIAFTREVVWVRSSNRAVGGAVEANAIACACRRRGRASQERGWRRGSGWSAAQGSGSLGWERLHQTIAGRWEPASMTRRRLVGVASLASACTTFIVTSPAPTAVPVSALVSTMAFSTE